jgi:hypothetical protein
VTQETQTQDTPTASQATPTQATSAQATQAQAKPASSNPDDRAQAFEAQQGAPIPEAHSGERLLVMAYGFIWVIAMVFVQLMWLRQRGLSRRLETLEKALEKAEPFADDDERMMKTVVKHVPKREMD